MSEDHIGYKKCRGGRIVVLEICGNHNEEREGIVDKRFAKMRCSKARVIRIYDMHDRSIEYKEAFGIRHKSFRYTVGEVVEPVNDFNKDLNKVCASGIHYFLTEEPAYYMGYIPKNGTYKEWYENGQMHMKCTFKNGNEDGLYEVWHSNGQMMNRCTCKNGKLDGLYEKWYSNGQIRTRCTFKNEKKDGLYEGWYANAQIWKRCTYKNGEYDGLCESWYENGQVTNRCTYKNGEKDGLFELWYDNGQILERHIRKNGKIKIETVDNE